MIKNVKKIEGIRDGSRKWFAYRDWTICRKTWNDQYSDVVVITDGEVELVFDESAIGWVLEPAIGKGYKIGEALKGDLEAFVESVTEHEFCFEHHNLPAPEHCEVGTVEELAQFIREANK